MYCQFFYKPSLTIRPTDHNSLVFIRRSLSDPKSDLDILYFPCYFLFLNMGTDGLPVYHLAIEFCFL